MKKIIKIAIIVSIIISVGVISTLAYLIQSDFFLIPKRTSSDQWTNTVDCQGENQLIYNDECVYVIKDNDPEIEYTNKYFMKKDDKIVVYCEKPDIPSEHVVGSMIVEICIEVKSYWISDDNVIKFSADYQDWNNQVEESVRQEIYDLLSDKDVEYYSINLDPKTGIIEIAVSDNSYDSQIKEIISKYTNDIEFNITYVNYTDAIILDDFK